MSADLSSLPSGTTSLRFKFPSEFDLAARTLSCQPIFGFDDNLPVNCELSSKNILDIYGTFVSTTLVVNITDLQNPIVEDGPFSITYESVVKNLRSEIL